MTGKEAIRMIADLSIRDADRLARDPSTSATVRRVCAWRVHEPAAFEELAVYASARPRIVDAESTSSHMDPVDVDARVKSVVVDAVIRAFATWSTSAEAAERTGIDFRKISRIAERAAQRHGYLRERRLGAYGVEWRLVPKSETTCAA